MKKILNSSLIKSKYFSLWVMFIIVIMGGIFRFYNLEWDGGYFYHPDEITVANMVSKISIPDKLDPQFYSYNSFAPYMDRAVVQVVSVVTNDPTWLSDIVKITLIGRVVSATLSTATIILIYILAKMLKGKRIALISAFIAACSVIFIQHAHYIVTETALIFFLLLVMIFSIKIIESNKKMYWLLAAIFSGLSIGTKMTGAFFLIIPALTIFVKFMEDVKRERKLFTHGLNYIIEGIYFLAITFTFAFLSSPYSLLKFDKFMDALKYENGMVSGTIPVPYTVQYFNTEPFWYQFYNLNWSLSFIIPTIGFIGIIWWLFSIFIKKEKYKAFPILLFCILFFLYIGVQYTKFMRYTLPLVPVIIIGAAWFTVKITEYIKDVRLKIIPVFIVLFIPFIWAFMYMSVYTNEHTWRTTTEWVYYNVPAGSNIVTEHWDYSLPHALPGLFPGKYRFAQVKGYDAETDQKYREMALTLSKGDYMIIASKRLTDSIPREDEIAYPIMSKYYDKLFSGKLGYTVVQHITSYPRLGPWEINDNAADESFQVYDHSPVYILKNEGKMTQNDLFNILYLGK
ncbi:MAG: glycosyltransferase family 39 protein [bacterium]